MPFQTNIGAQPLAEEVNPADLISADADNALVEGTDDKLFVPQSGGTLSLETPTGDVDGVNDEFVFTAPPIFVTYQGVIQDLTEDYTLVGSTVTFVTPPVTGAVKGLVSV